MFRAELARACLLGLALAAACAQPSRADPVTSATEAYRRGDYPSAFAQLKALAEDGYDSACVIVGRMYLEGQGTPKDAALAAKYFKLASDRGSASAANFLADLYSTGEGVPIDPAEAIALWRRAGHLGDPFAARRLGLELVRGIDVPEDKRLALLWLDVAVEQLGDAEPGVRAQFASDRDALLAQLTPAEIASAAQILSPEAPTPRAVIREEDALLEQSRALYPASLRAGGGAGSVVVLLLVDATGKVLELKLECSSGVSPVDAATMKLMRGASIEPRRVNGAAVAAWQVIKWTWKPKG